MMRLVMKLLMVPMAMLLSPVDAGTNAPTCPIGKTLCTIEPICKKRESKGSKSKGGEYEACVDLMHDIDNCGECGNSCVEGLTVCPSGDPVTCNDGTCECYVPPLCETRIYTQGVELVTSSLPSFGCSGVCLGTYAWTTNLNTVGNAANESPITITDMFPMDYNDNYVVNSVTVTNESSQICVGSAVTTPSPFVAEINGVTVAVLDSMSSSQVTKSGTNCPCSDYGTAGCDDFSYLPIDLSSSSLMYNFGGSNDLYVPGLLFPSTATTLTVTIEVCPV